MVVYANVHGGVIYGIRNIDSQCFFVFLSNLEREVDNHVTKIAYWGVQHDDVNLYAIVL